MSRTTTPLVENPQDLASLTREARRRGETVGFVPTMGALHRGHIRLVQEASSRADLVVVSVFVNPTQFGPNEDFERYPRTLDEDIAASTGAGAHLVYAPSVEAMYPRGASTSVEVTGLTSDLCGASRPGHFRGVATVVTKLFNQVGPCTAIFGRKDYQQLKVIERMVRDLSMKVEVVGIQTVREPDGLALSSRNAFLQPDQRLRALALVQGMSAAWELFEASRGKLSTEELAATARAPLAEQLDRIDYVALRDPETLESLDSRSALGDRVLLAMAGWLGKTRLIDNIVLGEEQNPLS